MLMALLVDWTSPAIIASLVAALVATCGLVAVRVNSAFADKYSGYFSAFAAGVLVMTALRLFPEALEITPQAPYLVLGGYLLLFVINALLRHEERVGLAIAPLIGIGLHSFLDGVEYGILFQHDIMIGIIASIGLILHEFAEGMILFALLRTGGLKPGMATVAAFFGAALTTPVGALVSVEYLHAAPGEVLGVLIALASGALLYIGATHLTMHIANTKRALSVVFYGLGVAVALALSVAHHGLATGDDHHHNSIETEHDVEQLHSLSD